MEMKDVINYVMTSKLTLESPREKTVHLQELVMILKFVVNNIVDIIHFDQNTVRSNLKELCKI